MTAKMTSETNNFFSFQLSEHTRMEHVFEIQETEVGRNVVIGGNLGVEDTYLQKEYEDGGVATYASEELSSRCFKFLNEDGNSDVIVNGLANLDQVADLPKAQGRFFDFLPIFIQVKTNDMFDKKKRKQHRDLNEKGMCYNVFFNIFHEEDVDESFGAPIVCNQSRSIPQYGGIAFDSADLHKTGHNKLNKSRNLLLVTFLKCELITTIDGRREYRVPNLEYLNSEVAAKHMAWYQQAVTSVSLSTVSAGYEVPSNEGEGKKRKRVLYNPTRRRCSRRLSAKCARRSTRSNLRIGTCEDLK